MPGRVPDPDKDAVRINATHRVPPAWLRRRFGQDAKSRASAIVPPILTSTVPSLISAVPYSPDMVDESPSKQSSSAAEQQLRHLLSCMTIHDNSIHDHTNEDDITTASLPEATADSLGIGSPPSPLSPITPKDFGLADLGDDERFGSICRSRLYRAAIPQISASSTTSTALAKVGLLAHLHDVQPGSYASVSVSRDLATSRVVCSKIYSKKEVSKCPGLYLGLLTELIAYQHISSSPENARKWLMELHGVVQDVENVFYVMDRMDGDLHSYFANDEVVEPTLIRKWVAQIALGIDALHKMGIIHRDIKPENILLDEATNNVRITDFTNAWISPLKNALTSSEYTEPLKRDTDCSRRFIGTQSYLAPEIYAEQWYGIAVDWWALGCVVYYFLQHEVLFPDFDILIDYVNCKTKKDRYSFLWEMRTRPESHLPFEIQLMHGLLELDPSVRFHLKDVKASPFFSDDKHLFKNLRKMSITEYRGVYQLCPAQEEFYALHEKNAPVSHATPHRPNRKAGAGTQNRFDTTDFSYFGWINPNGIWGSL